MVLLLLLTFGFSSVGQPKAAVRPPPVLNRAEAQAQGKALITELLSRAPEPSTRTNLLRIRDGNGRQREFPVRFEIQVSPTNWCSLYETLPGEQTPGRDKLSVTSQPGGRNIYRLTRESGSATDRELQGNETMVPFAGSDFWVADLGLEFLHWPDQLLLRKELRKGQSCDVLESTNPAKTPGAYSKVIAWIDIDTGGIVHADAYDQEGRIFKQFDPSELQKVQGHMQVKEIEMRNRKTGSRSWVTFDLK